MARWESDAETVRQFDTAVISGLLQTSGYARAVLSTFHELILLDADPASGPSVAEAVSARVKRQEVLADITKSFHFLLAESALGNRVCSPDEMPAQIQRLRQVARQDNVSLMIIPADAMWRVPPMHGFQILDEKTVVVDLLNTTLESHTKADARMYRQVFDWLSEHADRDIDPILDRYLDLYVNLIRSHS